MITELKLRSRQFAEGIARGIARTGLSPSQLTLFGFALNSKMPADLLSCPVIIVQQRADLGADTPMTFRSLSRAFAVSVALLPGTPALAASCGTGSFDAWLTDFKNEAAANGISQAAIASGLTGVTLDQAVISRDRSQRVFARNHLLAVAKDSVIVRCAPPVRRATARLR